MTDGSSTSDLASTLAGGAPAIDVPPTLEGALDAIAHAARDAVPGFDHVGISVLHTSGVVTTMAATGQLVQEMDTLQYHLAEGPCLSAIREKSLVLADDLAQQQQRWPRYVPRASRAGVRTQMGVPLVSGTETLGGLNFYSTSTSTLDAEASRSAELFAAHAALALAEARRAAEANEAVPTRQLVGQATGILMERFELTEERALYYLVRVAAAGHLELRDVARVVVDQVALRARQSEAAIGD